MSVFSGNVSEYALFKLAVEQPRVLDTNLSQLNLTFVTDGKTPPRAEQDPTAVKETNEEQTLEVK